MYGAVRACICICIRPSLHACEDVCVCVRAHFLYIHVGFRGSGFYVRPIPPYSNVPTYELIGP